MIGEDKIELIEKHLFGKLSEQEKIVFDQLLKNDKDFAEEVAFMQDFKISSSELGKHELRSKLKVIGTNYKTDASKLNHSFKTYFAIAASVVAIVGISTFFYLMQSNNGKEINSIADLQNDTIKEVNKIIANSSPNTKFYNVNQAGGGYGFAESDSSSNKFPVLIISSTKYTNHYLYRDTLILFLPSEDSLRFCSFPEQSKLLYFEQGNGKFYSIELIKNMKLAPIKKVEDKEVVDKIKEVIGEQGKN